MKIRVYETRNSVWCLRLKLHNEIFHNFDVSENTIRINRSRRMKLVGCEDDNTYSVVFMQSEGKKPGGIPRCKQEYNIRMDLKECSRSWSGLGKAERN